ncbi:nuclear transport factor 2 family protein [Ktedonospora formicarum]|uniref:SnoaL-like domain-containing protein n=1 Tax=Ktedonospora formicarum TaxID=2778364 RepID=A0A8J3MQ67_9CHLR|nr:nuclear transport factor 2 family protein [Ktedonospora formicarum]GHO43660.1 hypothetical protein KSX_18230 [Ktedonospora formicarum]
MSEHDIEIVREFMTSLDNNDSSIYEGYLSDNFTFAGWTPKPLDRAGFLEVARGLETGLPGLTYNLHNVLEEREGEVSATWQITGYQSDAFIIPVLGLPPIPQTGQSVSMPSENVTYTLKDEQIRSINVEHVAGGGIKGLIAQLGIDILIVQ